jgi:3-deoxy-D-manno-octulosonic-acid transferase
MHFIYTLLLTAGIVVASPYYLARFRRYAPTFSDRLGFLKIPQLKGSIWIHAVSVGEVKAVEKLIEKLRGQYPSQSIVVSTATTTGQQLARKRTDIIDYTFYFPLDLPGCVKRVLDRLRPAMVIIAETEIWPNFLRACRRRSVPVMMVNGRISDKSFARYKLIRGWLRRVLADYTMIGMQSETDRQRIEEMGGDPGKVAVLGNLKYDIVSSKRPLDPALSDVLVRWNPLWVAASTMSGEDELVLDAFLNVRTRFPALKLLVAPRHPERFDEVEALVKGRGVSCIRRSALERAEPSTADVLLLDTIGELAAVFEYACVVFVGGSLVPTGGHNILEPARRHKPVVFGPHMENFRDMARLFREGRAAIQINRAGELAEAIDRILSNPDLAAELGRSAGRIVEQNTGATERTLTFLQPTEVRR